MDGRRRDLERQVAQGDAHAEEQLRHVRCRMGDHCGCSQPINAQIGIRYRSVGVNTHAIIDDDGDGDDEHYEMVLTVNSRSNERNRAILQLLARRLGVSEPELSDPIDRQCSYCAAAPGSQCVTSSGKKADRSHAIRADLREGFIQVTDNRCYSYPVFDGHDGDNEYFQLR